MFAQGGLCFFCKLPLAKVDATVEHLMASSKNGSNSDDNCMACCRTVNGMLGSMSLKEKIQVVLNQKGQFKCPNQLNPAIENAPVAMPAVVLEPVPSEVQAGSLKQKTVGAFTPDHPAQAIQFLEKRAASRPKTVKTLNSTLVSFFKKALSEAEIASLTKHLEARGIVEISGTKVSYP